MDMSDNNQQKIRLFSNGEISKLCDSIKDIHRLLEAVGEFFYELDGTEDAGGNALQIDFKKWGIRTIAQDLLDRQQKQLGQIAEIYNKEQEVMMSESRGAGPC